MTKRTGPFAKSSELEKFSETVGIFYEFLGEEFKVKPENEILEKFRKMANI